MNTHYNCEPVGKIDATRKTSRVRSSLNNNSIPGSHESQHKKSHELVTQFSDRNPIDVDSPSTSHPEGHHEKNYYPIATCILSASLTACDGADKKVNDTVDSSEVGNSNYQDMVPKLKVAGFTNVSTKEIDDLT